MKRFQFSMEKVLEYKSHMEDTEKTILQEMRSSQRALQDELSAVNRKYEQYRLNCDKKYADGVPVWEIVVIREYMEELKRQTERLLLAIEKSEQEIERQIGKILGISREKSSIEKLKEKQLEEYRKEQSKAEEVFIDDFVANAGSDSMRVS